ncbi:hypothetical protein EJB05_58074, partial [Eragrostis curvula]
MAARSTTTRDDEIRGSRIRGSRTRGNPRLRDPRQPHLQRPTTARSMATHGRKITADHGRTEIDDGNLHGCDSFKESDSWHWSNLARYDHVSPALNTYDTWARPSLCRLRLPYDDDAVALSVQLVSFACGGFSVLWSSGHVVADGCTTSMLIDTWSGRPRRRPLPRPLRFPASLAAVVRTGPSFGDAYTPDTPERQVNVLTNQSFVEPLLDGGTRRRAATRPASREGSFGRRRRRAMRMEVVSAFLWKALTGVVGSSDASCRMGFAVGEASVEAIRRSPPPDVASLVREAVAATANAEHFQELVNWLEDHKAQRYIEAATVALGSPTLTVTWMASFQPDTDFGFGRAALAMTKVIRGRECSGYIAVTALPGDNADLLVNAFLWPRLTAVLESVGHRTLKPVTAEYLGFFAKKITNSFCTTDVTGKDLMAEKPTNTK